MMRDADAAQFVELAVAFLDGRATAEQVASLNARLEADAALRDLFVRLSLQPGLIGEACDDADADAGRAATLRLTAQTPAFDRRRVGRRRAIGLARLTAAAVVAAAAALAVVLFAFDRPAPGPDRPSPPTPVATLVFTDTTVAADDGVVNAGDSLAAQTIHTDTGQADLLFTSGAHAVFTGPAEVRLDTPLRVTMTRGRATFTCPRHASGFTVDLPGGVRVVDLGTRFTVAVDDDRSATVRVLDGRVRLSRRDQPTVDLAAGSIARVESGRPFDITGTAGAEMTAGGGAISFVQADPFERGGTPGNTVRADEPDRPWCTEANVNDDGLWRRRSVSHFWPGYRERIGEDGFDFETLHDDRTLAPELVTTVAGLPPGRYEVFVVFPSQAIGGEVWGNRADLDAPAATRRSIAAALPSPPASIAGHTLCFVPIGVTGAGVTGFGVHVRPDPDAERGQYIGVAYRPASASGSAAPPHSPPPDPTDGQP